MNHHIELGFNMAGLVDVSERLGTKAGEYDIANFVDRELDDEIELEISWINDLSYHEHEGFLIGITALHVENPETGRVFHVRLRVYPKRQQIQQIRDYCNLLMNEVYTDASE